MDWKVSRLTQELRKYDSKLYAHRASNGMVQVFRKGERVGDCDFDIESGPSGRPSYLLFALTENWTLQSVPKDWGIEPVMLHLREMDGWGSALTLEDIRKQREANELNRKRATRNENRARAMDVRRDFAKAVNDINTSTLEKVDPRRKHGY